MRCTLPRAAPSGADRSSARSTVPSATSSRSNCRQSSGATFRARWRRRSRPRRSASATARRSGAVTGVLGAGAGAVDLDPAREPGLVDRPAHHRLGGGRPADVAPAHEQHPHRRRVGAPAGRRERRRRRSRRSTAARPADGAPAGGAAPAGPRRGRRARRRVVLEAGHRPSVPVAPLRPGGAGCGCAGRASTLRVPGDERRRLTDR